MLEGHRSFITVLLFLSALVLALLSEGCMNIQMRIGKRVDPASLTQLVVGKSTQGDVVARLGAPTGKGRAMLPIESEPRTLWSYYYEEGDLNDSRRIFLFIFFKGDLYDGYMWFSSLPR
jgi:hypothetical protein